MPPRQGLALAGAAALAAVVGGLLANFSVMSVALALGCILAPAVLISTTLYFYVFILARPAVDLWRDVAAFGLNLASIMSLLLLVLCLKDWLLQPDRWRAALRDPFLRVFNSLFGLFLLLTLGSFLVTRDWLVSAADFLRLLSVLAAVNYAAVYCCGDQRRIDRLITAFIASSLIPVAIGLAQWATGTGMHLKGFNRIYGTFTHCNVFAEFLLLMFFLALLKLTNPKARWGAKAAMAVYAAIVLLSILQTYTRTVWIALAVTAVLYAALRRSALAKLGWVLLVAGLGVQAFPYVKNRFEGRGQESSMAWRMDLWQSTVGDLQRHPLVGNGLGMYERDVGFMAHNDLLRIAYEAGIPAAAMFFIVFAALLWLMGRRMLDRTLTADADAQRRLAVSCCLVVGLLVCSLAVNTLRSTIIAASYLCIVAALLQPGQRSVPHESLARQQVLLPQGWGRRLVF